MIKVVCLDLDGVFFEKSHQNLLQNLSKKFDLDPEFVKEVLFTRAAKEGGYNQMKLGKINPDEYWQWLFQTLGLEGKITKQQYLDELHRGLKINSRATSLIEKLRSQGIQTVVCSNNYKDNIDGLKKKFNLEKFFDLLIFSYEVHAMKPDSLIFQHLIEKTGSHPEEIVFSDDKQEIVEAAQDLGIQAFHYQNFDQFQSELRKLGVRI